MECIHDKEKKEFRAQDNGATAGRMTYTWAGDQRFIIDHTEVNPAFSGKGVGKKLVMTAVAFARKHHLKILPLCPFAKSTFEKNQDIKDVLA